MALKSFFIIFAGTLALLVPLAGIGSTDVDVTETLQGQTRIGTFATGNDTSVTGVDSQLSSLLRLTLQTPQANLFWGYGVNLSTRWTDFERQSLYVMHQLLLGQQYRISRRTSWNLSGTASVGKTNFSRALSSFESDNPVASTRPNSDSISYLTYNTSTGLSHRLTKRAQLSFSIGYSGSRQLGATTLDPENEDQNTAEDTTGAGAGTDTVEDRVDANTSETDTLPTMHNINANVNYSHSVGASDNVSGTVSTGFVPFSSGPRYYPVTVTAGWTHQINSRASASVQAGSMVAFQDRFEENEQTGDDNLVSDSNTSQQEDKLEVNYAPVLSGSISIRPETDLPSPLNFSANAAVNGFIDPVRATFETRLSLGITASYELNSEVAFQLGAFTSTPLSSPDEPGGNADNEGVVVDYPGTASMNANVIYNVIDDLSLYIGAGASTTMTYPFKGDFKFGAKEYYASISLVFTIEPNAQR